MHSNDDGEGLTVGLEEVEFADVHDGVVNFGHGNTLKCAVTIGVDALARETATHRSAVAREATWHRSEWHRSVAPGCGKKILRFEFYRLRALFLVKRWRIISVENG
jgi:hypothetical protein